MTGRGLWIPKGHSFAKKSVLLSKKQIVNILVYEYLNLSDLTFHSEMKPSRRGS